MIDNNSLSSTPAPQTDAVPVSNSFSWHRVRELAEFYFPFVKEQLMWYAIVSVVVGVALALPFGTSLQIALWTSVSTLMVFMVYLSPLVFTRYGDTRVVERQLPALPSEKLVFFLLYTLVVIPAIVYIPMLIGEWVNGKNPFLELADESVKMLSPDFMFVARLANIAQPVTCALVCLWCVVACKRNRTVKGIMSVFAIIMFAAIVGAAWGIIYAINRLESMDFEQEEEAVEMMVVSLPHVVMGCGLLMLGFSCFVIWRIYKSLKRVP